MKAILRIDKCSSQGSATGKTAHNYREREISNADPERKHLNEELVNTNQKDIWTLANERIEDAGIKRKVKDDSVRAVEFILTASPEFFPRDTNGKAEDVRGTDWLHDNLEFMKARYGKNLVAFTLHQDEKTPHIHAIVVPITEDNRLSAKKMFNPQTLRELQTDYAKVMKEFGLERGVERSTAIHQDMRKLYGAEAKTHKEITKTFQMDEPSLFDKLNLKEFLKGQEQKANELLKEAQRLAIINAKSKEEAEALKKRLDTSERLKEANFDKLKSSQVKTNDVLLAIAIGKSENYKDQGEKLRQTILDNLKEDMRKAAYNYGDELRPFEKTLMRTAEQNPKYKLSIEDDKVIINVPETTIKINLETAHELYKDVVQEHQKEQSQDRGLGID